MRVMTACVVQSIFRGKYLVRLLFPGQGVELAPEQVLFLWVLNIKYGDNCSLNFWNGVEDLQIFYLWKVPSDKLGGLVFLETDLRNLVESPSDFYQLFDVICVHSKTNMFKA